MLALVALLGTAIVAADRPNIVLIMADDMGYETVSSYGAADYDTPRLDALAAGGVRFTQAHSQPLCTPSRVQIMTGQYNVRNYTHFGELDPAQRTFGNAMRDAGYATAIVGKWQLGKDRRLLDHFGFDEHCLWWLERKSWRYGNVGELIQNGEVLPGEKGEYGPDVLNAFVLDFIERHADEPFFVYYPMLLPHSPFVPTPRSAGQPGPRDADPKYFEDMVEYTDELVGRVVDHLDALGLRENTLVIFVGDNGTNKAITSRMTDGREIRGAKGTATDGGTRVPMIVSQPGSVVEGLVAETLVDFSDIYPTLLAVADAEAAPHQNLDGYNLMPGLRGEAAFERKWSYCWYKRGKDDNMVSTTDEEVHVFARTVRYKRYRDGRFYDIARDPLELQPLAVKHLSDEARKTWQELGDVIAEFDQVEASR
jgi:arylsulfatase A